MRFMLNNVIFGIVEKVSMNFEYNFFKFGALISVKFITKLKCIY